MESREDTNGKTVTTSSMMTFAWVIAIFAVMGGCIYYSFENGLENGFTFDDHLAIDGNHDVTFDKYDSFLWFHDIWGKDLLEDDSHKSYRPLLILIFHYIWNYSNNPFIFRVISVGLHFVATCSVYFLGCSIFSQYGAKEYLAFTAALLFATHPIHVESVTAVVNLAEPASAIFIIWSYLIMKNLYEKWTIKGLSAITVFGQVVLWFVFLVVSISLKETGIISLLLCVGYLILSYLFLALINFLDKRYVSSAFLKWKGENQEKEENKLKTSSEASAMEKIISSVQGKFQKQQFFSKFLFLQLLLMLGIYFYFVFRELLTSSNRFIILSDVFKFVQFAATFLFQYNGSKSYLNASGLIRRAENPYVFLHSTERVLSYLVSTTSYLSLLLLIFFNSVSSIYIIDILPY
jgi:hypothetical protein